MKFSMAVLAVLAALCLATTVAYGGISSPSSPSIPSWGAFSASVGPLGSVVEVKVPGSGMHASPAKMTRPLRMPALRGGKAVVCAPELGLRITPQGAAGTVLKLWEPIAEAAAPCLILRGGGKGGGRRTKVHSPHPHCS